MNTFYEVTVSIIFDNNDDDYIDTETKSTVSAIELRNMNKKILVEPLECYICLDKLCPGSIVRQLSCQHCFCINCIDPWLLEYNRSCPICKRVQ